MPDSVSADARQLFRLIRDTSSGAVEATVVELRRSRPYWGPRRLVFELVKRRVTRVPSESAVYRALLRADMIDPADRDRRSRKWKRWERGAPMVMIGSAGA